MFAYLKTIQGGQPIKKCRCHHDRRPSRVPDKTVEVFLFILRDYGGELCRVSFNQVQWNSKRNYSVRVFRVTISFRLLLLIFRRCQCCTKIKTGVNLEIT